MIFFGIHPVTESLRSQKRPEKIAVERGKDSHGIKNITDLARVAGIEVEEVDDLRQICGNVVHQGVAAKIPCSVLYSGLETMAVGNRVVMLDGVQDPHNFGAALRVCDVFGFRDVIFYKGNSSGITPAVIKVSAGAVFHLNLYESNLNKAVQKLQDEEYALYALDGEGDTSLYEMVMPEKLCVVVGSESKGVRFAIKRQAAAVVRIPMQGKVNSLNVSCALTAMLTECAHCVPHKNSCRSFRSSGA